jgi:lipoate-protein ligase B
MGISKQTIEDIYKTSDKMMKKNCIFVDLPVTDYQEILDLQRAVAAARKNGLLDQDIVLSVEHPLVFTLGRNAGLGNILASDDFLRNKGIEVIRVERGGDITCHGPGQVVMYPILDLNAFRLGVKDYVAGLEHVMARTAGEWGIRAGGHEKNRGVWVEGRKLGSVGVAVTRGISFHGLALNVNISLEPFTWIHPCGLPHVQITSMNQEIGRPVPLEDVRAFLKHYLAIFLKRDILEMNANELRSLLPDIQTEVLSPFPSTG